MKNKFIYLAVAGIVLLASIREDAAEGIFIGIKCIIVIESAIMYNKIKKRIKINRLRKIREDNSNRRALRMARKKYVEVEIEKVEKEHIGF